MSKALIAVIGAGECDERIYTQARQVGAGVARAGFGLICGGRLGVMEAACRGAREEGGLTIGILPGDDPSSANEYVDLPIATGMGIARNVIIVRSARAVIAINGGPGTLSELAHCLQLGIPAISLGSFDVSPEIIQTDTPERAVELAVAQAQAYFLKTRPV